MERKLWCGCAPENGEESSWRGGLRIPVQGGLQELEALALGGSCSLFCFLFSFISFVVFLAD